jgi:signal peptidase I
MRKRRKKEKKPALILRLVRHYGWNPGRVASEILEWIEVLAVAGILAFLVISFVTVRMHVPTDSMWPTIDGDPSMLKADSFFVDMISYHFRRPKPGDIVVFWHTESILVKGIRDASLAARAGVSVGDKIVLINQEYVSAGADEILASLPEGEPITLTLLRGSPAYQTESNLGPKPEGTPSLEDLGIVGREQRVRYVKRLIAVGGEIVQIKDGHITIDGVRSENPRFDREYLANRPGVRFGATPTLVPEGKWFLLGDNSQNSLDSRYWGFADKTDFIGEPYFRVWPLGRFGPMNGYFSLHGER